MTCKCGKYTACGYSSGTAVDGYLRCPEYQKTVYGINFIPCPLNNHNQTSDVNYIQQLQDIILERDQEIKRLQQLVVSQPKKDQMWKAMREAGFLKIQLETAQVVMKDLMQQINELKQVVAARTNSQTAPHS